MFLTVGERGFKVKEDLLVVQARLAIPPSTCGNLAMSSGDVSETSKIANVRIYVEQKIGRLKTFRSKQYNCFLEQKLLFRTINKKEQITTNLYNTIHIFFLFWKITICWRLTKLWERGGLRLRRI
jgi:hypothetical protein